MRSIFNTTNFVYNNRKVVYNFQEKKEYTPSTNIDSAYFATKPIVKLKNKNLTFRKKIWQLYQ